MMLFVDGGVLGGKNPGDAVYYSVALEHPDGRVERLVEREVNALYQSNNQAEYLAVLRALEIACWHSTGPVHIKSDSQLIVEQLNDRWRVGDPQLKALYEAAKRAMAFLDAQGRSVTLSWVPRAENVRRLGH